MNLASLTVPKLHKSVYFHPKMLLHTQSPSIATSLHVPVSGHNTFLGKIQVPGAFVQITIPQDGHLLIQEMEGDKRKSCDPVRPLDCNPGIIKISKALQAQN